jgi:hypothetical protein
MNIPIEIDEDFFEAAFAGHSPYTVAVATVAALQATMNIANADIRKARTEALAHIISEHDLLDDMETVIKLAR